MTDILYGLHPVKESLLAGERQFQTLFLARGRRGIEIDQLVDLAKAGNIEVKVVDRRLLAKIAKTEKHQGVVGICSEKKAETIEAIFEESHKRRELPLILILDGIEDPRNLGSMIRSAEAFGFHGVIVPKHRAARPTATVAKTSAGALEHIPFVQVVNIVQTLEILKERGIWVIGAEADSQKACWSFSLGGAIALVLGGEGKGIRPLVKKTCDEIISIPMRGKLSSLNVAVACGILLYEVIRQREEKKLLDISGKGV
ncbi:MAG: 23S rRNA (guanosine(2251)-2'-O)-methyltransferase RlmB [Candidatus Tectomicrobia bacterium]|nr:23S rRNA (guanosine(2251)-2'-O)-methyltransferase RlmB [Candidatus Tectomicrobia bacterium]